MHVTIETLLKTMFFPLSAQRGCKKNNWGNRVSSVRESLKKRDIWKGAAVHRELEPGSRGITIVRSRCQASNSEEAAGWNRFRVTF
jgi:hypothetical protein